MQYGARVLLPPPRPINENQQRRLPSPRQVLLVLFVLGIGEGL